MSVEVEKLINPNLPDWGVFLRWPEDGEGWLHPEDLGVARELIPSDRVFRRSSFDGEFYLLHYGPILLRCKPAMWLSISSVDLEVEQAVELLARQGKNDSGVFHVSQILYRRELGFVEFCLKRDSLELAQKFRREDLRPLQVQYHLRAGFYEHTPAKPAYPDDLEKLDVGDLLGEVSADDEN